MDSSLCSCYIEMQIYLFMSRVYKLLIVVNAYWSKPNIASALSREWIADQQILFTYGNKQQGCADTLNICVVSTGWIIGQRAG